MKKKVWIYALAWALAVLVALTLAAVTPSETHVMGHLPALSAKRLDQQPVSLPEGLPAGRTLALITFQRSHRPDLESWIDGLRLRDNPAIPWLRMAVLSDPGDPDGRSAIETRLLAHYPAAGDRARVVPVFTDRSAFIRATGLDGTEQMYAVVLSRNGEVLARVQGRFDADKAQLLRETLLEPSPR